MANASGATGALSARRTKQFSLPPDSGVSAMLREARKVAGCDLREGIMEPMSLRDSLVGWTADGRKVYVTIEIMRTGRQLMDIDHEPIAPGAPVISMHGVEIRNRGSFSRDGDWRSGGQNRAVLAEVHRFADNWTRPERDDLLAIWREWHLNDMRSHCAHQDPAVKWDAVAPCPLNGYRAGTAWLYAEPPLQVLQTLTGVILHHSAKVEA